LCHANGFAKGANTLGRWLRGVRGNRYANSIKKANGGTLEGDFATGIEIVRARENKHEDRATLGVRMA